MQRGKRTLYNTIVPKSIGNTGELTKRDTNIEERRNAMAHRYYFHATICRLRYDDCLQNLHKEFFLQPDTIISELQSCFDVIKQLADDQTTTAELKKRYPFYNWVYKLL